MQVYRGDSFMLPLQVFVDGQAQDCTDWEVKASYGTLTQGTLGNFQVEWQDRATGSFFLKANTKTWPLGNLEFDVTYVTDVGQEITTQPIKFEVLKRYTPVAP
jgi:hypothetical protein